MLQPHTIHPTHVTKGQSRLRDCQHELQPSTLKNLNQSGLIQNYSNPQSTPPEVTYEHHDICEETPAL